MSRDSSQGQLCVFVHTLAYFCIWAWRQNLSVTKPVRMRTFPGQWIIQFESKKKKPSVMTIEQRLHAPRVRGRTSGLGKRPDAPRTNTHEATASCGQDDGHFVTIPSIWGARAVCLSVCLSGGGERGGKRGGSVRFLVFAGLICAPDVRGAHDESKLCAVRRRQTHTLSALYFCRSFYPTMWGECKR